MSESYQTIYKWVMTQVVSYTYTHICMSESYRLISRSSHIDWSLYRLISIWTDLYMDWSLYRLISIWTDLYMDWSLYGLISIWTDLYMDWDPYIASSFTMNEASHVMRRVTYPQYEARSRDQSVWMRCRLISRSCCSVLQCVAVFCVQCVAVCCSLSECVADWSLDRASISI